MIKNILYVSLFTLLTLVLYTCKKEDTKVLPAVVTASVDEIDNTSARVGGKVTFDGGAEVTERGVYWGTSSSPETGGAKLPIGTGLGIYFDNLSGLTSGVKYYVKAYATNSKGTAFGDETFFTTQISLPTITTSAVSELTPNSAKIGGVVSDDGGFEVSQRGVFWGVYANPRLTGVKLAIGSGEGEFSQTLTGLSRAITYYVTSFATNVKGTAYGEEISFTTDPELPTIYTTVAIDIEAYSATIGGEITSSGGAEVTERGVYWGTSTNPQTSGAKLALGAGVGSFSSILESLSPGDVYYFQAYAINSKGTAYGTEATFTTLGKLPDATTLNPTNLESTSITLSGLISANDLSTTVTFEYGTTTAYGTIVTVDNPVTEVDDTISVNITGLTPATTYHFRVKAANDLGITEGADSVFTTVITGIVGAVTDNDGNTYLTIGIGYQEWMTQNLRTTKYNDGSNIPSVKEDTSWVKLTTPAYCWYNNDSLVHANHYGALYNWYTVSTDKLCPAGWHIPTSEEIAELVDYLGNASKAGGLLKETGTLNWNSPNTGATNEYNFTALPGGKRLDNGNFDYMRVEGNWWGASNYSTLTASCFYMLYNYGNSFQANINKKYGMSVRCVKD